MNKAMRLIATGLMLMGVFSWGMAKDNNPKLENVYIQSLDTEVMTLSVEGMDFWIDAQTKLEDDNSNRINFSSFAVGDRIEIWFDRSNLNQSGFIYASKIELD